MTLTKPLLRCLLAGLAISGATLAAAPARAAGASPGAATPVQREQAQARFGRGKQLFLKRAYAQALVEFQASLEIVASPNTRLYVARSYRQMGKLVEAYVELARTSVEAREHLAEDSRYAKTGEAAEQERRDIAPQLGFVSITIDRAGPETRVKVGLDDIGRAGWSEPFPVMPGTSEIIVESPQKPPQRQQVQLAAGDKKALSFDADALVVAPEPVAVAAPPPPPPRRSSREGLRPYAYVAAGVGVVGFVTFVIAGLKAKGTYDDLASACNGPCPASRQNDIYAGKTQQTVANFGLVVGAVGAAAGLTLFLLSTPAKSKSASAAFVASPSWIGMRGAF